MEPMNIPDGLPTLSSGAHAPGSGNACVMEYVSLLAGEPWTDHPACTHPMLAEAARIINDRSLDRDRHLLVPLIGRLFGSTLPVDARRLALWCARSVEHLAGPETRACNDALADYLDGVVTSESLTTAANAAAAAATATYAADTAANAADTAANAAAAATYAVRVVADVADAAEWLSSLIDEYDRLTGRTEHRELTDTDLRELASAVAR